MKLTVLRRDLHPAVTTLIRTVEARTTIPILANIAFEATSDGLLLRASDLDIEVSIRVEAIVEEPGSLTVSAARLHTIVGKLADGPIDFAPAGDPGDSLRIASGRSRFTLQTLPLIDFPTLEPKEPPPVAFDIGADILCEAIKATAFAISTEETRYYLNGIYLHVDAGQLIAVATDGHRLSRWARPVPAGAEGLPGIIVPRKAVGEIAKIAEGCDKPIHVQVGTEKIIVTAGDVRLISRLIDGSFPDYGRVIPSTSETIATVGRAELTGAVERVTAIRSERGSGVKFSFTETGGLTLSMRNPDAGSSEEEVPFDGGSNITIGFNGRYVADALATLTGDRIEISLTDAGSPAVWRPGGPSESGAERLIVLMPLQVS